MSSYRTGVLFIGLFSAICAAVGAEESTERVAPHYSSAVALSKPVSSLPARVAAPLGQLTLFADFDDVAGQSVRLYLINRTGLRIGFSSQNGDPFIKMEFKNDDGEWERAQPHTFSWCGNSYLITPSLRPEEYYAVGGYFPSEGEVRSVRYRMYQEHAFLLKNDTQSDFFMIMDKLEQLPLDLMSNVGTGRVRLEDVGAARRDRLAARFGTFATVREMALGPTALTPERKPSSSAVEALARFPTEQSFELLRGFLGDANHVVAGAAMRGLAQMGLKLEAAEQLYQQLLHGDDVQLRQSAIRALEMRPVTPEVIAFAKEQLSHDDLGVRIAGCSVIACQCKDDDQAKAFINGIYDDPDPKIQSIFETVLFPTCINYQERGRKGRFRDR